MTKAEMIYNDTMKVIKMNLREEIRDFTLPFSTDQTVSTRTVNDIEKIQKKAINDYISDAELGIIDRSAFEEQALRNMNLTIKAWRETK